MTLFDSTFRKHCHYLDQTAQRCWGARFLGRPLDRRWAGGSEFVGHSDYTSGDDLRHVDWPICARHDELLTRQFRGSEDRVVYLILDCSPGMALGRPVKFDVARQLAAALGYMALGILDRVGVVAVASGIVAEMTPVRGMSRLARLFHFLESLECTDVAANLPGSIETFVQNRPRRGITILISDLFDPAGFEDAVDLLLQRGFPPYLLQVADDQEAEPTMTGGTTLKDIASDASRSVYLEELDLLNYRKVFREFSQACRRYCARRSIGITQTRTGMPVQESVLQMIRSSTSRMATR